MRELKFAEKLGNGGEIEKTERVDGTEREWMKTDRVEGNNELNKRVGKSKMTEGEIKGKM